MAIETNRRTEVRQVVWSKGIMRFPVLIINFKVYKEALKPIAYLAKAVAAETGTEIVLCPSHVFLKDVSKIMPVFAQNIDPAELGAHTGAVIAEYVKAAGGIGALINHSEKRIPMSDIKVCVERCKAVGLLSCVCAASEQEVEQIAKMNPDMILIEPPELVGGNVSVSTARPEIVKNSVEIAKRINRSIKVLCGAGIKNRNDVKKAIELGADGVGVSSGIVKAPDIEKAIRDIAAGFHGAKK